MTLDEASKRLLDKLADEPERGVFIHALLYFAKHGATDSEAMHLSDKVFAALRTVEEGKSLTVRELLGIE